VLDSNGINRLLEAAQSTMYYSAIHFAVFSGLRRSEVLGLRWRDLDLDGGTLTVNQVLHVLKGGEVVFQEPKTARSKRTIALYPASALALKAHREKAEADRAMLGCPLKADDLVLAEPPPDNTSYGKPMLPNTLTHAFTKIARKAGLNVRLHDLRHTHISQLIRQGIYPKVIADRAGHSTINTTMGIYGHLFSETQREAAIKFELGLLPVPDSSAETPSTT
jgi:integrase